MITPSMKAIAEDIYAESACGGSVETLLRLACRIAERANLNRTKLVTFVAACGFVEASADDAIPYHHIHRNGETLMFRRVKIK